ncbi:MAG: SAM-dependent methyltransferase, partial [bacterium]
GQLLNLSVLYMIFFLPFLFAATCIGLAITCLKDHINRVYFFDMFGAGIGALTIIGVLFLLSPQNTLKLLAIIAIIASVLMALSVQSVVRKGLLLAQCAFVAVLLLGVSQSALEFRLSPFKGLSQALQVVGTNVLIEYSNPLGHLSVVESPTIPFRDAPGLSFNTQSALPEQIGVFTDGDGMSVITRFDGNIEALGYMGDLTAALPYQLLEGPKVLILGAGGGADVLSALYHDAREIHAVELNPLMIKLVRDEFSQYAGQLYDLDKVTVVAGEARGFVTKQNTRYDLIQVALLDSFSASGSGVQTLNESYLYTVEAFEEYLRHLEPDGIFSVTRWLRLPPRDSLKLFATAAESLRRAGVKQPERQLAMIRSWNTSTLLIKKGVLTNQDIESIRTFSSTRSFDVAFYPDMPVTEANRFNLLAQPYLYEGALALLSNDADHFKARYKFDIGPATDDRPYFFHFFKWGSLPEMLSLRERGGAGMIEWAYLVLAATLVQAAVFGALLILMPLSMVKSNWPRGTGIRMGAYFFVIGIAFMFVEMAFIQKLILFLSHPLYSVAVVLCGFLVFAGLGSRYSMRLVAWFNQKGLPPITFIVVAIISIALIYLVLLPQLFIYLAGVPDAFKIAVSLMIIAPLAFFMGMPFPIGLSGLAGKAGHFIPWAWGLNGYASVMSASLATLFAIEFGFSAVLLMALGLYFFAATLISQKMSSKPITA